MTVLVMGRAVLGRPLFSASRTDREHVAQPREGDEDPCPRQHGQGIQRGEMAEQLRRCRAPLPSTLELPPGAQADADGQGGGLALGEAVTTAESAAG
jgi:hypothetical protein